MQACALASLMLLCACGCVTVLRRTPQPLVAKHKEELPALYISCKLNDIVTISAPIRYQTRALYYLYRPSGDVTQLDLNPPVPNDVENEYNQIVVKYNKDDDKHFIWFKDNFKIANVNFGHKMNDTTNDTFGDLKNEFVIGPLGEDDYGNWVLSLYTKENGEWVEWFQVITIDITEPVPIKPPRAELSPGDTFKFGFAYPLQQLSSCQLAVPSSSFDRFYERCSSDSCKFIVRNVTKDDEGYWEITGVGRIAYVGRTYLKVINKTT